MTDVQKESYEVEKGIPVPSHMQAKRFPFLQLDVGDSFFVPNFTSANMSPYKCRAQRETGRKFITRAVDGGLRVWRVE